MVAEGQLVQSTTGLSSNTRVVKITDNHAGVGSSGGGNGGGSFVVVLDQAVVGSSIPADTAITFTAEHRFPELAGMTVTKGKADCSASKINVAQCIHARSRLYPYSQS